MKYSISEEYVIEHCLGCSKQALEEKLFPMFQAELNRNGGVKHIGYQTPIYSTSTTSFQEWCIDNYEKLRHTAYGTWEKQLEMIADGTFAEHINQVKERYPKE